MALTLSQTQAIARIAKLLYSYLPGTAHPYAKPAISFATLAARLGLSKYWTGGSKLPALTALLESTLEFERPQFCPLVVCIVREGMKYRLKKGDPVTRDEIEDLNRLLVAVQFKIPELNEAAFIASLQPRPKEEPSNPPASQEEAPSAEALLALRESFMTLDRMEPRQRGFALEKFLNELFACFCLEPRSPFRLMGEQIDGSLEFGGQTYLIEAKWQSTPVGQAELLIFQGKVTGKTSWSRGLFVSISGYSTEGLEAFGRGRPSSIIAMSGQDLYFILEGKMSLPDALRLKARRAAETGEIMISVYQLVLEGEGK